MELEEYRRVREAVCSSGFAHDIEWSEGVSPPQTADAFAQEYVFVVCNSGMRAQVAQGIYRKVMTALIAGSHPRSVFGHKGKCDGIWAVWSAREVWFINFLAATDPVQFLGEMPWIGTITKWHLAKNFGVDVAKPDRHLVRVAQRYGTTPQALCEALALASGDRIGTVDTVIWRACNLGILDAKPVT
ncbi:hypothetical protein [Burkholderia multivorans]|uniref:hypothetical protein n=1 Tax=Burkholderia multivorans TaxID=87883 RepID=UPI00158982AD|nr:hypothetical protein [Burkholderia multivorans]MDR8877284.1 hypothetical protein [Burkholderia multivorans]MDR8882456.1 hypothetical protein [Burkholderia multivorans]MDR8889483.1 hypothetical protein [Burkholderia multivorans]MDR8908237.1 hypothetical protein [Burkholderia multivorans]MDR8915116.1 hypothetical protein [Burkholderia multivorans]